MGVTRGGATVKERLMSYLFEEGLYSHRSIQDDMSPSTWLRTQLDKYWAPITILFILSALITIGGYNMAVFWSHAFEGISYYMVAAVLNTVITFIVIRWGLNRKEERKKAETEREKAALGAIAAKDSADKVINEKVIEAAKWKEALKFCKKELDERDKKNSELALKLDGARDELKRYKNAPSGTTHPEKEVKIKANVAKPSREATQYSKCVEEINKEASGKRNLSPSAPFQ